MIENYIRTSRSANVDVMDEVLKQQTNDYLH